MSAVGTNEGDAMYVQLTGQPRFQMWAGTGRTSRPGSGRALIFLLREQAAAEWGVPDAEVAAC